MPCDAGLGPYYISLEAMSGLIGDKAAHHLFLARGGSEVSIPKSGKSGPLVDIIGQEALALLSATFGGIHITLGSYRPGIPKKVEVIELVEQGLKTREIARTCGVSDRYVRKIRQTMGEG